MASGSTREMTADMLTAVYKDHKLSSLVLKECLDKQSCFDKQDRSFMTRLFKGTLENTIKCDYVIERYSRTPLKKLKPIVLSVLRMSVYEFLYMPNIPHSAVVNESVKIIKHKGLKGLAPFVNGVLRNVSRNIDELTFPEFDPESPELSLSINYSCPKWIVKKLIDQYGTMMCEEMLKFFELESKINIRINTSLISPSDYKELLSRNGIAFSQSPYYPYALILDDIETVQDIPGYDEGLFAVQDPSSMIIGDIASHLSFSEVIDLCSAPGGKTMHIADIAPDCHILALDKSQSKTDKINENLKRCRASNVSVSVNDATEYNEKYEGCFDLVIMDVPCSGIGVIGTKPDIRYNISQESIASLNEIQKKIILNGARYLRTGGHIIYSTCTLNMSENIGMLLNLFGGDKPKISGFEFENITGMIPSRLLKEWRGHCDEYIGINGLELSPDIKNGFVQVIPGISDMNGFFVGVLKKIK